jgi:DNA-binding LacI/PurR family transcriptional regulator
VGFDDIPAASWPTYNLTTIQQPVEAMVARATALLIENEDFPPMAVQIPGRLILRGSARFPIV